LNICIYLLVDFGLLLIMGNQIYFLFFSYSKKLQKQILQFKKNLIPVAKIYGVKKTLLTPIESNN